MHRSVTHACSHQHILGRAAIPAGLNSGCSVALVWAYVVVAVLEAVLFAV
jgi:hypothetical protein